MGDWSVNCSKDLSQLEARGLGFEFQHLQVMGGRLPLGGKFSIIFWQDSSHQRRASLEKGAVYTVCNPPPQQMVCNPSSSGNGSMGPGKGIQVGHQSHLPHPPWAFSLFEDNFVFFPDSTHFGLINTQLFDPTACQALVNIWVC